MSQTTVLIQTPEDVTVAWLARQIGAPDLVSFTSKVVGTGQTGLAYRLNLEYSKEHAGPATLILKVSATDAASRASGVRFGLYEREVRFYTDIAPTYESAPLTKCYYGAFDEASGTFALLLADAGPAICGDDIVGATLEQSKLAMSALGELQGPLLRDPSKLQSWVAEDKLALPQAMLQQLFNLYVARYREKLTLEELEICAKLVGSYDAWCEATIQKCALGMIHGDYRLDNLLFGEAGAERPLTVVDWQTLRVGAYAGDLAYFLGCAIKTEDRRQWQEELLSTYLKALGPDMPLTREKVLHDLKYQTFFGIVMAIGSPILVGQTERGDEMFMAMMKRLCQLVLDLGSLDVLPAAADLTPLKPSPEDEGMHPFGTEEWYNESWYFDFCDPQQGIGCWVRLGVTPNQEGSWYTAFISRPGRPMIEITDFSTPQPNADRLIKTGNFVATHTAEYPLKLFRVTVEGQGASHAEEAALFKEQTGSAVKVALDLQFKTDGDPYRYRVTTRYEIPCLVDGTVTIDGEKYTINNQFGQRDHSWGVRDWWSMEWCWGTLHCEDMRLHYVDLGVLGSPARLMIGYVQGPRMKTTELDNVVTEPVYGEDDLVTSMKLSYTVHGAAKPTTVEYQAISHGPVRFVSTDGKVAEFDRAWCKGTWEDGRVGYGWVEWNKVVKR